MANMTFTTNLIPKVNGLTLGNSTYKWQIYSNSINGIIPPSTSGTSGQYLVSRGSSSAPEWASVDTTVTQSSSNLIQSGAVYTALSGKQNNLGFTPVNKAGDTMSGSLASTGVKIYASDYPTLAFAASSTDTNPAGAVFEDISAKRITIRQRHANGYNEDYLLPTNTATSANATYDVLTSKNLDTTVTQNSTNPITSGAVYNAITSGGTIENANKLSTPRQLKVALATTYDSSNPVTFDGSANVDIPVNGTLPITSGGTGATSAADALSALGALSLGGGTLTGPLVGTNFKSKYGYEFERSASVVGGIYLDDYNNINQVYIDEFTSSNKRECYVLPAPTNTSSTAVFYDILTSKNAVTIAQGGTGATDAATARTNLGVAASDHTHTLTLATDTGTSSITLASAGKYKLTAGGNTLIFTMPTLLALGNDGATAAAGNHTHTTSLATDTGTSSITLASEGKYKLTAGGNSVVFTMPSIAASNHTHTTSITQSGTATINLAANTTYTLTAGGSTVVFKTPADNNTTYTVGTGLRMNNNQIYLNATYSGGTLTITA